MRDRMAVRENPKGNKEIQESREMSEVVFMNPTRIRTSNIAGVSISTKPILPSHAFHLLKILQSWLNSCIFTC